MERTMYYIFIPKSYSLKEFFHTLNSNEIREDNVDQGNLLMIFHHKKQYLFQLHLQNNPRLTTLLWRDTLYSEFLSLVLMKCFRTVSYNHSIRTNLTKLILKIEDKIFILLEANIILV